MNVIDLRASMYWLTRYGIFHSFVKYLRKRQLITEEQENGNLAQADKVIMDWPRDIPKPRIGIVNEYGGRNINPICYWTKYRRFCENNDFPYGLIDIHRSDFIEQAAQYDIIVWHTMSDVASQVEAETKITVLEKHMGKMCLPSVDEIWFYEDKVRQAYLFSLKNLPVAKTFVSNDYEESMQFLSECKYPLVSKIATGSSSMGVKMIKRPGQAKRLCKKVFGTGATTFWTYSKQKDYVYFQEFLPGVEFDLRIICIGDYFLGYYRKAPKGDFRASGGGIVVKESIPTEALQLAKKVKETMPHTRMLAVDLLRTQHDQKYYIAETSIFIRIDTCEQLHVDGKPGRYIYKDGQFVFEEGKFWVQELALQDLLIEYISKYRKNERI